MLTGLNCNYGQQLSIPAGENAQHRDTPQRCCARWPSMSNMLYRRCSTIEQNRTSDAVSILSICGPDGDRRVLSSQTTFHGGTSIDRTPPGSRALLSTESLLPGNNCFAGRARRLPASASQIPCASVFTLARGVSSRSRSLAVGISPVGRQLLEGISHERLAHPLISQRFITSRASHH